MKHIEETQEMVLIPKVKLNISIDAGIIVELLSQWNNNGSLLSTVAITTILANECVFGIQPF